MGLGAGAHDGSCTSCANDPACFWCGSSNTCVNASNVCDKACNMNIDRAGANCVCSDGGGGAAEAPKVAIVGTKKRQHGARASARLEQAAEAKQSAETPLQAHNRIVAKLNQESNEFDAGLL